MEPNIEDLLPVMNVVAPQPETAVVENIISDTALLGVYNEILTNLREEREEVTNLITTFSSFVVNDGDATSSSKEALVNLIKTKAEMSEKMAKIADLMTRVKLRERDTFPRYLAAHQNNTINIGESANKRELLKSIEQAAKKTR